MSELGITLKPKYSTKTSHLQDRGLSIDMEKAKIQNSQKKAEYVNLDENQESNVQKPKETKEVEQSDEKKDQIWDSNGNLLINLENEEKFEEPVKEKAVTEDNRKERIQKNTELAKELREAAKKLKNENKPEQDEKEDAFNTIYKYNSPSKSKRTKNDPEAFMERQQKSIQKKIELQTQAKEPETKSYINPVSKAYLRKTNADLTRTICDDYKKPQPKQKGPVYSFKPDQRMTINYPLSKPRFGLVDDFDLIVAENAAKKSSLVVESNLELEQSDIGLSLITDEIDRNRKAKRALKRMEERQKEKKETVEIEPVDVTHKQKASKMPKQAQELNKLFSLFK